MAKVADNDLPSSVSSFNSSPTHRGFLRCWFCVHTGATSARILLSSEYRSVQQRTQSTRDHHLMPLSWRCQLVDWSSGVASASLGGLVKDTGLAALGASAAAPSLFSADILGGGVA